MVPNEKTNQTNQQTSQKVTRSQMPVYTLSARLARRAASGLGSIVRALCGAAAGWQRPQPAVAVARATGAAAAGAGGARRRGSTIVLVVSSLALFALITVAYVGLGIGDRRTGSVTVAADQVDDVAGKVRDYLVDVIGRDAVAVFVEERGAGASPAIVREAWDYPWTDPNRVSRRNRLGGAGGGSGGSVRFDPAGTMPRQMVEEIRGGGGLASLKPFAGSDPWLASTEPTWLAAVPEGGFPQPRDPYYLDLTSWWQISNFAPDGMFVNLHALRPEAGGFGAEPGIATNQMSYGLLLVDDNGVARGTVQTIHDERPDKYIPAHWTMFQKNAARPVGPGGARPNEVGYAPYSWVDADGDGIYDSRWFELVDAFNTGQRNGIVSLLPRDGRYRWFVAARAIDLSSLVNINTARDVSAGEGAPTDARPIGVSPADVDMLRIFTLEDVFALTHGFPAAEQGYSAIHRPVDGELADYFQYNNQNGFEDADRIGQQAYQALLDAADRGVVPAPDKEYQYPIQPFEQFSPRDRQQHFVRTGAAGGARWQPGGGSGTLRSGAAFGIQDLVELLTYHGLNDDVTLSRLEQIVGGRDDEGRYSPLRDNRPLSVEGLADVGPNPLNPTADGRLDEERLALLAMDPRRRITTLSGATQRRSSIVWPNPAEQLTQPQDVPEAIARLHTDTAPARLSAQSMLELADVQNNPSLLFEMYASALLPLAEIEQFAAGGGGVDPWVDPEYRTLFYGYDPLFALRAAAHMAANRLDSWDSGTEGTPETPTAVTLVMNGASPPAEGDPEFPWQQLNLDADGAELLPTAGDVPSAVNIYGIEAQPFLVQASTFIMYTDTPWEEGSDPNPSDRGGDREWIPPTPGPGPGQSEAQPATIHGNVSRDNPDFIFQAFAFQINNPFDESLNLADYHIEFADREFDLEDEDENPVVIPPRQSVVVYVLSQTEEEIALRMSSAASGSTAGFFVEQLVEDWIEYQFRGGGAGEGQMTIVQIYRDDEPGMGTMGQVDMLQPGHGIANPDHRSVLLWRTINTPAGDDHDMLIDRLRDTALPTGRPTLDRRLPDRHNFIGDSLVSGPGDQDDEGFSMTMWGSIRRPEDPRATEGAAEDMTPRGGLPAWCIESRFGSMPGGELNIAETDDFTPQSLRKPDFDESKANGSGAHRLTSLMQAQTNDPTAVGLNPQLLVRTLRLEPWAKSTPDGALGTTDQEAQMPYWSSGATPGLDPELHLGPQRFDQLRIGDMLMAMAVGPVEDPLDPEYISSGTPADKWTTLSESLALALGYDEAPGPFGGEPDPTAFRPTITGPTPQLWRKTDRGFLRLDDFTPFIDGDGGGLYDPTDPGDILRGDGIPMALSLLDAFRPSFGAGDSEQLGSLTNPTSGVININTAPLSVLRTLGLLSPTASEVLGGAVGRNWLGSAPHGAESDIASTVAAYRDKAMLYPRFGSATDLVSFVRLTSPRGVGDTDEGVVGGRSEHTGIEAVREQPGFRTLGEIMLARDLEYSGTGADMAPHDIDRFAVTGAMTADGVESFTYRNASGLPAPDALAGDYDEKLAIFNSLAGKISVRSDLYAVWFVLHGYQREDVEGLTDDDPLLPSVAKRFLIIVDRSNVTTEGERPRILHFQELPL